MTSGSESGGEFTVPSGLLQQLAELAKHWGVTPRELLAGSGLDESEIAEVAYARCPSIRTCRSSVARER